MTKASILGLLKAARSKRRFREQKGTVVKRTDGFYIRFYRDGDNGKRIKVTERLCDLSVADPKKRALLKRSHMSAVNNAHHAALRSQAPAPLLTVGAFYEATYLPWVKANKRFSTIRGYEYDWRLYIQSELAGKHLEALDLPADQAHDRLEMDEDLAALDRRFEVEAELPLDT